MYVLDHKSPKYLDEIIDHYSSELVTYLEDKLITKMTPHKIKLCRNAVSCFLYNSARSVKLRKDKILVVLREAAYSQPLIYNGKKINRSISYTYTIHLFNFLQEMKGCKLDTGGITEWEIDVVKMKQTGEIKPVPSKCNSSILHLSKQVYSDIYEVVRDRIIEPNSSVIEVRDNNGNVISKRLTIKQKDVLVILNMYNQAVRETPIMLEGEVMDVQIKKIYNESSYEKGGRNYIVGTDATKLLKKENRFKIHINGEPCLEVDYAGLFPRIIADFIGVKLCPEFDPYSIEMEGYDPQVLRGAAKVGMMCVINTSNERHAALALSKHLSKGDWKELIDKSIREGKWKDGKYAFDIINLLVERNSYLVHYTGTKEALALMNIESDMNDYVMQSIMMDDAILLPLHDGFVVPESYEQRCKEIMLRAYELTVGGDNCVVKSKVATTTGED